MISKDDYNISRMFLAYLAFRGNATKVAIALGIQREIVHAFATQENWPDKLQAYLSLRHSDEQSASEQAMNQTAAYLNACHLRDMIHRVIQRLCRELDDVVLIDHLSRTDPKTNCRKIDSKVLLDLTRALYVATRIIDRVISSRRKAGDDNDKQRPSLARANELAEYAIDRIRGFDSVDLAKESLAAWRSDESSV